MRRLLRLLLTLILLVLLFGLLTMALAPFLISPHPAPGVTDARSVSSPNSRFLAVETDGEPLDLHYVARPGADRPARSENEPLRPTSPTFVLLHGFTFNLFTWNRLIDVFEHHGSVIAYDQAPYGLSAKPVPQGPDELELYSKAAALQRLFALGYRRVQYHYACLQYVHPQKRYQQHVRQAPAL